jgi:hypothetical protein
MYVNASEGDAMINAMTQAFLLPGNLVCNLIGAEAADDRGMTRTLVNMLFWNLIRAFVALHFA